MFLVLEIVGLTQSRGAAEFAEKVKSSRANNRGGAKHHRAIGKAERTNIGTTEGTDYTDQSVKRKMDFENNLILIFSCPSVSSVVTGSIF